MTARSNAGEEAASDDLGDEEPPDDTVGLVGAGRVGQWFVTKLVRAGYEPVVFDVDAEAVADAVDRGGTAAEHPADVASRVDVVVLSVPTREAVESVMEGEDGILETLGAGQVVVDTGTTPPDVDVHYRERCRDRGAGYVDCGITRHGPGEFADSREPAYTLFVGGDAEEYRRVEPVLEALGHEREFFEGIGNGHVVKAAVVLRASCRAAMAAEVCEFLANNGIEPGRVVDLLDWDVPDPFVDPPEYATRGFERAVEGDDDSTEERSFRVDDGGARPRLRTSEWAKDPSYALEVARSANTHVPMLTAAYQMRLLTETYGAALVDRDLAFGDQEWPAFLLRAMYRVLNRPKEEWRRLGRWAESTDGE